MKRAAIVVLLGLLGCVRESPSTQTRAPVQPEATHAANPPANTVQPAPASTFGEAVTLTETTALTDIAREPARYAGRTVRTEGTISAVCQAAGCWMEIQQESSTVHVKMHGHSFFIPRDARGRRAVVQANVIAREAPPPAPAHAGNGAGAGGNCGGGGHTGCNPTAQAMTTVELDALGVQLL